MVVEAREQIGMRIRYRNGNYRAAGKSIDSSAGLLTTRWQVLTRRVIPQSKHMG